MALSDELRTQLRKPFGQVLHPLLAMQKICDSRPMLLAAVGDDTIYRLLKNGMRPDIGVFDLRCRRKSLDKEMEGAILDAAKGAQSVPNPPGTITRSLSAAVGAAIMNGSGWIRVDGEDDLASLLFMAHSPDGTVLLYGQPDEGMVWVDVDDAVRGKALDLLLKIREG